MNFKWPGNFKLPANFKLALKGGTAPAPPRHFNLDEQLEQLSFGKTTLRLSACLGIYMSPEALYVASVRVAQGAVSVDQLMRLPLSRPQAQGMQASGLEADFLGDGAALGESVRKSLEGFKKAGGHAVLALSQHVSVSRYFLMPAIERRFWKSAIPIEARKRIPFPFETLITDYQVIPVPAAAKGKPRQGVLAAATAGSNPERIKRFIEASGLKMAAVEPAACSFSRLLGAARGASAEAAAAHIHADPDLLRFLILDRGLPVSTYELALPPQASVNEIRRLDPAGALRFAVESLGIPPLSALSVSGQLPDQNSWSAALARETGLRVDALDVARTLGLRSMDWGASVAVGAALRFLLPHPVAIDLSGTGRVSEEDKSAAKSVLKLAAVMAAYFLGVGAVREARYQIHSRDLARYHRDPQVEAVFKSRSSYEVQKIMAEMHERTASFSKVLGGRLKVGKLIEEAAAALPPSIWITSIDFEDPVLSQQKNARPSFEISGAAEAPDRAEAERVIYSYRDALMKSPMIAKNLGDVQVSLSSKSDQLIAAGVAMPVEANSDAPKPDPPHGELVQFKVTAAPPSKNPAMEAPADTGIPGMRGFQ